MIAIAEATQQTTSVWAMRAFGLSGVANSNIPNGVRKGKNSSPNAQTGPRGLEPT